jgi:peptide/nickel transport system permease protein
MGGRQGGGWARMVWRQFTSGAINRASVLVIAVLLVVALGADMLASDQPLLAWYHGKLYVLPNVFGPPELKILTARLFLSGMGPADWAVMPVVPWGANTHDLFAVLQGPSAAHWLGTDSAGRDVLARLIHGSRVSLSVGVLSVGVLVSVGTVLGTVAGYYGGIVDGLVMRVVETVHSIPTILLMITMLAILAPEGWGAVVAMMLVIGLVRWTDVARLVRGEILRVRTLDYVQASRAQGASDLRIMWRHVVPNAMSPVLVTATFAMASAILVESALSFLGFGIPDDMASWGGLLNDVRGNEAAWWLAVFPGLAIFLTVTVYNLAGEGLRDAIDPRLRD